MLKTKIAQMEEKLGAGREIEILVEREVEIEAVKLSKITIAPDGQITREVLVSSRKGRIYFNHCHLLNALSGFKHMYLLSQCPISSYPIHHLPSFRRRVKQFNYVTEIGS